MTFRDLHLLVGCVSLLYRCSFSEAQSALQIHYCVRPLRFFFSYVHLQSEQILMYTSSNSTKTA